MKALRKSLVVALVLVLGLSALPVFAQDYDFGGKTVTFIGWVDNLEEKEKDGTLAEAEAKFNVKIKREILPQEDYQAGLMSRLISGDSEYDVWRMTQYNPWFLSLASQDALLSITETVGDEEYYGDALEIAGAGIKAFSLGGHSYPVALFPTLHDGGASYWCLFNKDIIEEAGLPDPYDLYFAGEWTWDAMRDIGLATTIDFDNDGTIDQWGIANMYIWAFLTVSNGDNIYVEDENGRVKYNWNSENILEGLAFGHQIRYVDKIATSGFAPFEDGNAAIGFGEGWRIDFVADANKVNYGVLPLPKGPKGENTLYTGWLETYVLPANVAEPEAMIALVDFLERSDDIAGSIQTLIDDRVNKWAPDIKAARIIRETLETYGAEGELLQWALVNEETLEAYSAAVSGEKTPAEAMNSVAASGQAYIDDILGYNK